MASLPTPDSSVSFWHSEPSDFLLGHQTTGTLPEKADVVIVGSGITGASAARFLVEDERANGLTVVMLEAREACWGATGRNGGHCQPLLFERGPDVAAFELRNYNIMKEYIQENDVQCEWRARPACRTFWTEALVKEAFADVEDLKRTIPDIGNEMTVVEIEEQLQELRVSGAPGAILTATSASLWPYKYVAFILEKLIKGDRLNLQTKTPVDSIERLEYHPSARMEDPRYVLHTPRGTIHARHVILATNAYTSHLLPEFEELIVPERGIMTALLPPVGSKPLEHSYGFVGANGGNPIHDDYLVQRPFAGVSNTHGHLMFGGGNVAKTINMIGESDDSIIDEGSVQYLNRELLHLLSLGGETDGLKELEATHEWSGIWGTSQDHHPWVGGVPEMEGVWLAGGYSGHGMPNATLSGKAVVDMMLADIAGADIVDCQEELVRTGNLPRSYLITKERIENCKKMMTVKEQDQEGLLPSSRAGINL